MPIPVGSTGSPPVVVTPTRTTPVVGPDGLIGLGLPGFTIEFQRDGFPTIPLATVETSPWQALKGAQGLDLVTPQVFSVPIPDGHGDVYLGSRFGTRELFLRVSVNAGTYDGTRDLMRGLWEMVGDLQPFDVVVAQPEGDRRRVTVRYVSGLEGSYGDSEWWVTRRHLGLTLLALDPLAYGEEVSESWTVQGAARPFLSDTEDFFPVVLGSSLVGGTRQLLNAGEMEAFPVTTVTGPGSGLVLTNVTTGKTFALTGTITQPFTIDARRGVVDVYDVSGDLWDRVTLGTGPFGLAPGVNTITVSMTGANSSSGVVMSWRPAYRSLQ